MEGVRGGFESGEVTQAPSQRDRAILQILPRPLTHGFLREETEPRQKSDSPFS